MIRSATALVALCVTATAVAAPRSAPSCFEAKGRTVAADGTQRAFTTGTASRAKLYACRRGARPRLLAEAFDEGDTSSGRFVSTQLRGRYLAYVYVRVDMSCKAACPDDFDTTTETLRLVDLAKGTKRTVKDFSGRTFGLTSTGGVAWMSAQTDGQRSVLASIRGERRTLARAAGIDPESLEASASRVTWLQEGQVTGATLR